MLRREPERVLQLAETARALAAERGYAYEVAIATILHGWAPATLGQRDDGVQRLREGLDAHRASGAGADHSYFLALLADASGGEEGLVTIKEAFETVDPDRPFFFDAELHRLHGELTLAVLRGLARPRLRRSAGTRQRAELEQLEAGLSNGPSSLPESAAPRS